MQPEITTKSLQGVSDLTLVAPIRPGLVESLEARTYESRLRAVLDVLHTIRQASREHSAVRPFSDGTDRIRTITDLRMAILQPQQQLLLSVSFDRPWEPYLRIVWRDVGTLLDLIFCNCAGYPISAESSFAEYGAWVRAHRTDVRFFFRHSALSFDDMQYLRQTELLLRRVPPAPNAALEAAALVADTPVDLAARALQDHLGQAVRQGMQALSVLHRLADLYVTPRDRAILMRAAHETLRELPQVMAKLDRDQSRIAQAVRARFAPQLAWFGAPGAPPAPPVTPSVRHRGEVQGGILAGYPVDPTHGCLVLIGLDDPQAGTALLATLQTWLSTEGEPLPAAAGGVYVNVGFSIDGLRRLGLTESTLAAFPHDFREGMAQRAGLLGDLRGNHPRNWSLPTLNWPAPPAAGTPALVPMDTVHVVVQLRVRARRRDHALPPVLQARIRALAAIHAGVRVLSVQDMHSRIDRKIGKPRGHFGFIDGISQPELGPLSGPDQPWSNAIGPGELLIGYANDRGDPTPPPDPLLDNGSFLAVRKLRMDVPALDEVVKRSRLPAARLKALMMGRTPDGDPLAAPGIGTRNDYDFDADKDGRRCPFQSHTRRANPRTRVGADGRPTVPRIMRRGMSYGPRYDRRRPASDPLNTAERGLVFIAYNASLSEQFEVVQRWVAGGNSSDRLSEHSDPLLGVPQLGQTRTFRFHDGRRASVVALDEASAERPLVKLEWGLYLFAPSATGLARLEALARAASAPAGPDARVVARGAQLIAGLREVERASGAAAAAQRWKALLEDAHARSSGDAEALWAAVRACHGGVLRTPYGVLVGSKRAVMQAYGDHGGLCSVKGYQPRLEHSIGMMYLGLDDTGPDCEYRLQSGPVNAAIMNGVSQQQAFEAALEHASNFLDGLIQGAKGAAVLFHESFWEVTVDAKEVSDHTLAKLCHEWFGIPDGAHLKSGGWRWDWQPGQAPYCPGHFTAPSRYTFQPNPGAQARSDGEIRGQALRRAVTAFVTAHRPNPPAAPLGAAMFAAIPDDDLLARTMLGTLIGFLPTVEGNFRASLNEWLGGGTERLTLNERIEPVSFWDLQNRFLADPDPDLYAKALRHLDAPLRRTMQLRPAPELGWRTAQADGTLAGQPVAAGEHLVIGIVSATQEDLADGRVDPATGRPDVYPVFGGDRWAADAPTHACPGHHIGMGVLLGMLAALMALGQVRASPAPLTVALRGTLV